MGFTSPTSQASPAPEASKTPEHHSFGDKLMAYMQQRYPIAGSLAGQFFGTNFSQQQAPQAPDMPSIQMPDYSSLIAQNAQPKQGGGLSTILKLFMGG